MTYGNLWKQYPPISEILLVFGVLVDVELISSAEIEPIEQNKRETHETGVVSMTSNEPVGTLVVLPRANG